MQPIIMTGRMVSSVFFQVHSVGLKLSLNSFSFTGVVVDGQYAYITGDDNFIRRIDTTTFESKTLSAGRKWVLKKILFECTINIHIFKAGFVTDPGIPIVVNR